MWNEVVPAGDETDLRAFAADLRSLRVNAGIRSLRELARRVHYSHTSVADAVAGRKLPSLELTLAIVAACGGEVEQWRERWLRVFAAGRDPQADPVPSTPWPVQEVADGKDPMEAGCHVDAVTVRAALVSVSWRRQIIGRVDLRYSRRRHAAWGRFTGEKGLDTLAMHRYRVDLTVGVTREADDVRMAFETEYCFDAHWSALVVTGEGGFHAWTSVRFDGSEVAYGRTDRADLA